MTAGGDRSLLDATEIALPDTNETGSKKRGSSSVQARFLTDPPNPAVGVAPVQRGCEAVAG